MRLIFTALGWIVGLLLAAGGLPRADFLWIALAIAALTSALMLRRPPLLFVMGMALAILRLTTAPSADRLASFRTDDPVTLDGVIEAAPDVRDRRADIRVRVTRLWQAGTRHEVEGLVLVQVTDRTFAGRIGDTVRASGVLTTPPALDRFSYTDYLARQEIYSILSFARARVIQPASGITPGAMLTDVRDRAERQIVATLPEPYAGLLTGILLGDERGIAPEVRDAFAATGAAHVVAISGFNMAVLGGMIGALVIRLPISRLAGALIAVGVIALYTVFVGASPSVVRAAVMSGIVFFGAALRRTSYLPTSLAFTVLALSLFDPLVIYDIGFQLSAFAVLGIALFAEPLNARYVRLTAPLPRAGGVIAGLLRESFTVGIAAQVFTLPLSALYFGVISPSILLVNILIAPVQPLIMVIGGLATLLDTLLPTIGALAYWTVMLPLAWTVGVVRVFAAVPTWTVYPSPLAIGIGFIAVIGLAVLRVWQPNGWQQVTAWLTSRILWVGLMAAAAITLILGILIFISRPDGRLHLYFFDTSTSAMMIVTPGGRQIVIDGGAYPSRLLTAVGDRMPFTDRSIDLAIITQPDTTLLGGTGELYDRYTVDAALINGRLLGSPLLDRLAARFAGGQTVQPESGFRLDLGDGVWLTVVHADPSIDGTVSGAARDDGALVVRLEYQNFSALLFGEASHELQTRLLTDGRIGSATLVQLPGGGERDRVADDLAERVGPLWVVVQGDRLNRRHFPDERVIARFAGARLLRTDSAGLIHIATDGVSVTGEGAG